MKHLNINSHLARPFVAVLAFLSSTCALADNISGDQALQLARQFVTHRAPASGQRHAPAATQQVTPAGQVSGLYVFNVGSDGGFVIVSNDDRTTPVLGFSDSGHLDTQNIPSNMRAWLQGYADEIAGMQGQSGQQATGTLRAPARTSQLIDNHEAVEPLLKTTWNQGTPYNDLAPFYKEEADGNLWYRLDYEQGYEHCATGCVATAMAQVMYYHKWPQEQTTIILPYRWTNLGDMVGALKATTFDWSNMIDSYNNGYTEAQGEAVSTLMLYCGWSVKMNYGPSSGASTSDVAIALKNYFDYNSETTKAVSRTFYTYADWMALIYHEVYNGRPVVYGGQSSGGGHSFVCDGYKYENGTDFFHINWGWGGLSDDYFVLSVLKPNLEGIGGNISTDGYHMSQQAVIGIQKSTEYGEVADISEKPLNLVLNSMTLDHSNIYLGMSVNVTLNVTNDSDDDFDGRLCIGLHHEGDNTIVASDNFTIPAGETVDCVLTYTPTQLGTCEFVFFTPTSVSTYSTNRMVYATLNVLEQGHPYDLAATDITHNSALVSWAGNADSYDLRYGAVPDGYSVISSAWLSYDNGSFEGVMGNSTPSTFTWGVMYPGELVTGTSLSKVLFYEQNDIHSDITITIYSGGDNAPGKKIYEETVKKQDEAGLQEVTLASPVAITPGENLWITLTATGTYIISYSNPPVVDTNGQWVIDDGGWKKIGDLSENFRDRVWIIRGCMDYHSIEEINSEWPVVTCTTPSCQLTDLESGQKYVVQVRGKNAENNTAWVTYDFTTLPNISLADAATENSVGLKSYYDSGEKVTVTLAGRTLYKDGAWNTLCLPFDLVLEGSPLEDATAKTLANATMTGTHVTLTFGDAVSKLEAGVPYIIKWEEGEDIVEPTFTNVTVTATEGQTIEKAGGNVQFIGYYDAFGITAANEDIYYMTADNTLKHTAKDRQLKALRAYFRFTEAAAARRFVLDFGDGDVTTAISSIDTDARHRGSEWYSLDGMKHSQRPAQKGVYVKDGKKIVVK